MTTVHILGAGGYAACEAMRLLIDHPDVRLGALESRSAAGQRVSDVFPQLPHITQRLDPEGTILETASHGDIVFLAADRELARQLAPGLLARGVRVIDFSDAFRLHANAAGAVYGLPERYRAEIAGAQLIANPGCYVTAALLALVPCAPFAERIANIIIDAKSGVTGAGRKPQTPLLFGEVADDVRAYGLEGHRHAPEIAQEILAVGIDAPMVFSPHVVPVRRGLLADVYLVPKPGATLAADEVRETLRRFYGANPFVTVLEAGRAPYLPALERTNDAQLAVAERGGIVHLISGIDNLGKGAAGQAVQNMNLLLGLPEERGLHARTVIA